VGHTDQVNAVKFGPQLSGGTWSLLSGSANGELCVWQSDSKSTSAGKWGLLSRTKAHGGAINAVATLPGWQIFVTGGSDSAVKIWKLPDGVRDAALIHTVTLQPRYIPLSLAVGDFMVQCENDSIFFAVGGTRNSIQTYTVSGVASGKPVHSLQATLTGHESWVTSLALKRIGEPEHGREDDTWLASASQDKSIRLWRISRIEAEGDKGWPKDELTLDQSLTAKVHTMRSEYATLSIFFDALLLGHEDWIYTASWNPQPGSRQLLSASADNSLIIWEPEPSTGIWLSSARLGEISATKGATSATGSTGGFWVGLWSQDANAIACLGKTGSWRLWQHDKDRCYWAQRSTITGHVKAVTDLSWTARGEYLLSTSSDQSTRLHAEWQSTLSTSWHEFARPQIHGYDLNCVQSLSTTRFVSGADEKLLRVFDQPKNVAHMLERLCKITSSDGIERMPESADMPVLGLSNKAIMQDTGDELNAIVADDPAKAIAPTAHAWEEPPTEDHLARHTLWPEHEKLYGHGHEISALAANRSGSIIATACKASSTEHAVIRLYDTRDWHEIRPSLAAHSLTIARLQFHMNDDQLLSVGRDRQWALFGPSGLQDEADSDKVAAHTYVLSAANPKGHSRMILDASWSSASSVPFFATAGRDKTVKIWASADGDRHEIICKTIITRSAPVTAIDICASREGTFACLAVGEETGKLSYHIFSVETFRNRDPKPEPLNSVEIEGKLCPSKAVTRLAWRPDGLQRRDVSGPYELAVASADSSLRILSIDWNDCKASDRNETG
jgi:elongator complex protein 2